MSVKIKCACKLSILLAAIVCINAAPANNKTLNVRIIHVNDMHARFQEISQNSSVCTEVDAQEGKCYGGFARLATYVRNARKSAVSLDLPTFFLVGGDTYQGSKLYEKHKWQIVDKFLDILRPDVMCLGNHEFDDGVSGLSPFLKNVKFPVVAANLDLSAEPSLQEAIQLQKSTILYAKNKKIGVVGYLTPETKLLSIPGNVKFLDEVASVREETKKLKSQGCDIIIALGHSGYEVDKKIAKEVEDVDLVVGGHSNTFLNSGSKLDIEEPEGPYPTVVEQPSGRKVYVVQAYAYTKYVGDLMLEFNEDGEIVKAVGYPVLMDKNVAKAEDVDEEVQKWVNARVITVPNKDVGV